MSTPTKDKTVDVCKHCGKEIVYDRQDGYWDNKTEEGSNIIWTPFNCIDDTKQHVPTNHTVNKKGYYHQIV